MNNGFAPMMVPIVLQASAKKRNKEPKLLGSSLYFSSDYFLFESREMQPFHVQMGDQTFKVTSKGSENFPIYVQQVGLVEHEFSRLLPNPKTAISRGRLN